MPDHVHEPQPEAAPVTPAATPAPAAAGPPVGVAQILSLQRTAGNRAVSRLLAAGGGATLARDPQPPHTAPGASARTPTGLTRADFEPTAITTQLKGASTVGATAGSGETVDLTAPELLASASVTMKPEDPAAATPGPRSATVGFVQTVLGSTRKFVYTEDGTPQGKVGVELHDASPAGSRDARAVSGARDNKGNPVEGSGWAPFYSEPRTINRGDATTVQFNDHTEQKGVKRKLEGTDGRTYTLARVAGGDAFRLSVGAIEVGGSKDPIHLAAKEWTVPWDMEVGAAGGQGGAIDVQDFKGRLEDIKPGTGWSDRDAQQFRWPRDEAEAALLDSASLIKGIPFAEQADVNAWMMMSRVLRARNPSCLVRVNLKATPSALYDQLTVTLTGPRTATRSARKWGEGVQEFSFRMLDLMDPQDLGAGMTVDIQVARDGGAPNSVGWLWPFNAIGPVPVYWGPGDKPGGELLDEDRRKKGKQDVPTEISVSTVGFG